MLFRSTGKYDFYQVFEQTLNKVEADSGQEIFRRLAAEAYHAGRSALVTNVPKPGLAEQILGERDAYLADMKASMTGDEIQQMIQDTIEFREWNESEGSNSDFMIAPSDIPDKVIFRMKNRWNWGFTVCWQEIWVPGNTL